MQCSHRGGSCRPRRVGDADDPGQLAVDRDTYWGPAARRQCVPLSIKIIMWGSFLFDQSAVADHHVPSVDGGGRPASGVARERLRAGHRYLTCVGMTDDRRGEWMLGLPFDRSDQPKQLLLVQTVDAAVREDLGHLRFALGQGAGLVQDDRVDPGRGLQRGRVLEQDAAFRTETGPHHDCRRGGEPQRVRAGDDDYRDREQDCLGRGTAGSQQPDEQCAEPAQQRDEHQPERRPVGQSLTGRLAVPRLLNERDDLCQCRVRPDLGGPDPQSAGGVDGRADHLRADGLVHRQALAGHHRLVEVGLARLDHPVDCDLASGADEQQVTDGDLGGRYLDRFAVPHHQRLLRHELEQGADRVGGSAAGAHLEPVPQQHERGEHGSRFVEDVPAAGERDDEGVGPAGADGDRDQNHHVQRPGAQRPYRSVEEDPRRPEDHREAEDQLEHVVAQPERRGHVEAQDVAADRRPQQDRDREERRDQETVAHVSDHRRHRHPRMPARCAGCLENRGRQALSRIDRLAVGREPVGGGNITLLRHGSAPSLRSLRASSVVAGRSELVSAFLPSGSTGTDTAGKGLLSRPG